MFNKLSLYISILAALILVACDDQNFDWEKARSNSQTVYEKNFKQIFGDIPANQCWDFTNVASHFLTRTTTTPTYTSNSLSFAYTDGDIDFTNNTSNESLYNQLIGNNGLFKSNQQAASSVLAAPSSGTFTIMPVTTTTNSKYNLYVKIGNLKSQLIFSKDWTDSGDAKTYTHNMPIKTTCGTCGGDKLVLKSDYSGATFSDYYSIYQNYSYYKYFCGEKLGNSSDKHIYRFITINKKNYLYDATAGKFLCLTGTSLNLQDNFDTNSNVTYNTIEENKAQTLKVGKYYITEILGEFSIGNWASEFRPTKWTLTKETVADTSEAGTKFKNTFYTKCGTCEGNGYTITSYASMPGITISGVAEGTPIQIYMDILDSDGNVTKTYSTYTGNVSFITPTTTPEKLYYSDGSESVSLTTSNVLYAGMAAQDVTIGSSYAFDDLTLAIIGESEVPTTQALTTASGETYYLYNKTKTISKRYMVEDMGFGSTGTGDDKDVSTNTGSGTSDIDFNDIVVDFEKEYRDKYTVGQSNSNNSIISWTTDSPTKYYDGTTTARIRALGGTWKFKLCVDESAIFEKEVNTKNVENPYKVQFNTSTANSNKPYKIYETVINSLEPSTMYNTGYSSGLGGDGNYLPNSWIAEVSGDGKSNIGKWDPDSNNISFILISNNKKNDDVEESTGATFKVDFPDDGDTPKMLAFPTSKNWQKERNHVTKAWFADDTNAVDNPEELKKE